MLVFDAFVIRDPTTIGDQLLKSYDYIYDRFPIMILINKTTNKKH